jgi:hypothetical protein
MQTQYEVIARHRKLHSETYVVTHSTPTEAVEWVIQDNKDCQGRYGYEIMTLRKPDGDCWHRVSCRYWLDGAEVTEADYLEGMKEILLATKEYRLSDKSHTIKA